MAVSTCLSGKGECEKGRLATLPERNQRCISSCTVASECRSRATALAFVFGAWPVKGDDNWDVAWSDTPAVIFNSVLRLEPFQCMNHFPRLGMLQQTNRMARPDRNRDL